MNQNILKLLVFFLLCSLPFATDLQAGNKRIMSINGAKVLAERALIESVYGLKVRATEDVQDMVAASFIGKTESKTKGRIKLIILPISTVLR